MAGKKINRNDKCPCGSGKKYKKCCIGSPPPSKSTNSSEESHPLSTFNRKFLIDSISNAFCLPQNHGKNIRLELIMRESLIHGRLSGGNRDLNDLKLVLDKYYPNHHLEDPREYLFSERTTFYGGEYIILPGIFTNGHFVLTNLLMSIFFIENSIPQDVKTRIYFDTILAFNISNLIAERSGIKRYQSGSSDDDLITLSQANNTFISEEILNGWSEKYNFPPHALATFLLDRETSLEETDPEKNPVALKPIIKVRDGFIVLSVTNIVGSLLHSIFVELIESNVISEALHSYSDRLWYTCVEYHLRKMDITPLDVSSIKTPEWSNLGVYKIDSDKLMIVVMNQDDASNYNKENIYKSHRLITGDSSYMESVKKEIRSDYPDDKILVVQLTSGIGRQFGIMYDKSDDLLIAMSITDFEYMMRLREYDALELWNYAEARNRFTEQTKLPPFLDELDIYALYLEKEHSFYIDDSARPNFMVVLPGTSLDIRERISQDEDIHSVPFIDNDGTHGGLLCLKLSGFERTYHPIDSEVIQRVVLGNKFPFWVRFNGDIFEVEMESRNVYIKMLEALSYWIWQIVESLEAHLLNFEGHVLTLTFDFRDRDKFETLSNDLNRSPHIEEEFEYQVSEHTIHLIIPETLNPYLYGKNNEGERILVKVILKAFAELQHSVLNEDSLTDEEINRILDLHVPFGIKKKIFLIDLDAADDMCLTPIGRDEPRYLQDYNINYVLDQLVPKAVELNLINSTPQTIADPDAFLKGLLIKVLLPWLNVELKKYSSRDLLRMLYDQAEMLAYTRRMNMFTLPPAIACFENYNEQVEKLVKQEKEIAQAGISARCLIEHIVALPVNEGASPSQSAIDHLLAIMDQIFAWGSFGDAVHFGLYESDVTILPSMRIGTDHSATQKMIEPFRVSKAKETIVDSQRNFESSFEVVEESEDVPHPELDEVNKAFESDFGFSLTRLMEFKNVLMMIAYNSSFHCEMNESELVKRLINELEETTESEVKLMLDYFSLEERASFFKPPKGFENHDISPWRYNRGLSLLRKPVLRVKEGGNVDYIWGLRQVELASQQIVNLIQSGRFKCEKDSAMSVVQGKMLGRKGTIFNETVFKFFTDHVVDYFVQPEVPIKDGDKDLGDVDVLVIDHSQNQIFLIECKKTAVAKNVKQLVDEIDHLFGSDNKKGWLIKHEERLNWLRNNIDFLEQKFGLELKGYSIDAVVLSSEQIPTKFLMDSELPFSIVSFYEIQEVDVPTSLFR